METREKTRKQYKKPQVSQVKLEIEEAVLTACKVLANDPGQSGKQQPICSFTACKNVGS